MKSKFILAVLLFILPTMVHADPWVVPRLINLQMVLVDDGGNVLKDKQVDDISVAILDVKGNILYEEIQPQVPIIHGAISVLIGSGNDTSSGLATGGIPFDVFSTPGDKMFRVKLSDQTIPQEDLQLVSVPYSYTAHQLDAEIVSEQIKDGGIMLADLNSEVLDLISQGQSPIKLPISAKSVSISTVLTNAAGSNVQTVLEGLDNTISVHANRIGKAEGDIKQLRTDLTAETGARQTGDAALQGEIDHLKDGTTPIPSYVLKAGDTIQGNLSMDDGACQSKGLGNCKVDGVDVSQLKTDFDGFRQGSLDPTFNTVQITGTAPFTPQMQTLYQTNMVAAWARVDGKTATVGACTTAGLKSSYNIRCVERLSKGRFRLEFEVPPVPVTGLNQEVFSYIVTGNAYGGEKALSIFETREEDFKVHINDIDQEPDPETWPFMVSVTGWAN